MNFLATSLPGVVIIELTAHVDARGVVYESFDAAALRDVNINTQFVRETIAHSRGNVVRGFHFQHQHPQDKFIYAVQGHVFDCALDVRRDSPTFGHSVCVDLTDANGRALYVPGVYAHGLCTPAPAVFVVKYSARSIPADQHGVIWNDPTAAVPWPVQDPILSEPDRRWSKLSAQRADLPPYTS